MTVWRVSDLSGSQITLIASDDPDMQAFMLPGNEYSLVDYLNELERVAKDWRELCAWVEDELDRISWGKRQRPRIFDLRRFISERRAEFTASHYADAEIKGQK